MVAARRLRKQRSIPRPFYRFWEPVDLRFRQSPPMGRRGVRIAQRPRTPVFAITVAAPYGGIVEIRPMIPEVRGDAPDL